MAVAPQVSLSPLSSLLRGRGTNRATLKLCGVRQLKRVTGGLLVVVDRILPLLCPPAIHIGCGTLLLPKNVRGERGDDFYTVFVSLPVKHECWIQRGVESVIWLRRWGNNILNCTKDGCASLVSLYLYTSYTQDYGLERSFLHSLSLNITYGL